jgi:hypothetical protein
MRHLTDGRQRSRHAFVHDAYSMTRIMDEAGACIAWVPRVEQPIDTRKCGNEELHHAYFGLT